MAPSNSTIVEEAIAAVAQFVTLPEPEKMLDGAKRVASLMDNANKFLAQSLEAILGDLQSSISKDEETKEALKNQLAELIPFISPIEAPPSCSPRIVQQTEDHQGAEESRERTVLTKEPRSEVGKEGPVVVERNS